MRAPIVLAILLFASPALGAEVYIGATFTQSLQRSELNGFGLSGGILVDVGSSLRIGPEVGWTSLGTQVTDVSVPGTGYDRFREEFTTEMWHASANAVWRTDGEGIRPFARAGAGALFFRTNDEIRYFEGGVEVPSLHFEQEGTDVRPGVDFGAGARFPFGGSAWGLDLEGRWRIALGGSPEGIEAQHFLGILAALSYLL